MAQAIVRASSRVVLTLVALGLLASSDTGTAGIRVKRKEAAAVTVAAPPTAPLVETVAVPGAPVPMPGASEMPLDGALEGSVVPPEAGEVVKKAKAKRAKAKPASEAPSVTAEPPAQPKAGATLEPLVTIDPKKQSQ